MRCRTGDSRQQKKSSAMSVLECGGLTPLWVVSFEDKPKAVSSHRTPKRQPNATQRKCRDAASRYLLRQGGESGDESPHSKTALPGGERNKNRTASTGSCMRPLLGHASGRGLRGSPCSDFLAAWTSSWSICTRRFAVSGPPRRSASSAATRPRPCADVPNRCPVWSFTPMLPMSARSSPGAL